MNFRAALDDWIENQKASEDENVGRDMYALQQFPPVPSVGTNTMPQLRSGKEDETLSNSLGSLERWMFCFRGIVTFFSGRVPCAR
jgi:hypothetical protein